MYQIEAINIRSFAIRKEENKVKKCGFYIAFHHDFKEIIDQFVI